MGAGISKITVVVMLKVPRGFLTRMINRRAPRFLIAWKLQSVGPQRSLVALRDAIFSNCCQMRIRSMGEVSKIKMPFTPRMYGNGNSLYKQLMTDRLNESD